MIKVIERVVRAPLSYIADLRKIPFKQYLMMHTNFSPSYPIMIFTSLATTLAFSAFIIYYVFTIPEFIGCISNVRGGAYIIAILYPIETILCFICLTGTIALSKNNCWKISWILLFGPVLSGFGFGELALIIMCLLATQNVNTFNVISIITQPAFIDAMVYLYISFLALYFVLVPSIEFLYQRQKKDEQINTQQKRKSQLAKDKEKQQEKPEEQVIVSEQSSCCNKFIVVIYYLLNALFVIAVIFIAAIKILGPLLFTYIWIEMASNSANYSGSNQQIYFALSLLAYFSPLGFTIIILGIQRVVKLARKKDQLHDNDNQSKERNTLELSIGEQQAQKEDDLRQEPSIVPKQRQTSIMSKMQEGSKSPEKIQKRASEQLPRKSARQALL